MPDPTTFADWVRRRRKALDLTQAALAEQVGCAVVTLRKIEQETRRPSRELAELLAERLAIPAVQRDRFLRLARGGYVERLPSAPGTIAPPAFLQTANQATRSAPFVARAQELADLETHLAAASNGNGHVVFVTGEAGSGKTSLVQEFSRRAQAQHADLIVATGTCHAYHGLGDPYLPFREILGLLTGDVEASWAAGALTRDHALRLWHLWPQAVQTLVEHGPDLIDTFVPGKSLVERAAAHLPNVPGWLVQLYDLMARRPVQANGHGSQQRHIFEEYTAVLATLAAQQPLLLILDDLHWADLSSSGLLFHLGQHMRAGDPRARILIVGTYRPEDVAVSRTGEQHPLAGLVAEFKRTYGKIGVDLDRAKEVEGRRFLDALLDAEPNRLGEEFRQALFRHTEGHALFSVELLRDLQERGDLRQDGTGRWVEGPTLSWSALPARVEGVIEKRMGRLDDVLHAALTVASVEGVEFTAEVVAHAMGIDVRPLVRRLTQELGKHHCLVEEAGSERSGRRQLSRFRFRHYLFQKYLYDNTGQAERRFLHKEVGEVLETFYADRSEEIAVQQARHFTEAGIPEKAVAYLHQAGRQAVWLSAHAEAIAHLGKGLALLETLPTGREQAERELAIQITLGVPLVATKGSAAPEVRKTYLRAQALCRQLGKTPDVPIVRGLASVFIVRAELQKAHELLRELLSLAQDSQEPAHLVEAHYGLGSVSFWMGRFVAARQHLEEAIARYDLERHRVHIAQYAQDPAIACRIWSAVVLWMLGYPDRAVQQADECLVLARQLAHPLSDAYALATYSRLHQCLRNAPVTLFHAEETVAISVKHGFPLWIGIGTIFRGWALAELGQAAEGLEQIQRGMAIHSDTGARITQSCNLALVSEAFTRLGETESGLAALDEALAHAQGTEERTYEAELHRRRGELLLIHGEREDQAEVCFQRAIDVARRQCAKSWELRASMSLSRLWQKQGKHEEARQMLTAIYDWFSEGFDTPDLQEAKELLEELR